MSIVPYPTDLAGHLTQLYTETKKSALSNVSRDTREDATPALSDLHRKFRIQKDRLITWGLEWSDEGKGSDGDIDGSVARAGLTETVTSVLENIKEVLQQAERIRSASTPTRSPGWGLASPEKSSWLSVDSARYKELVTDLTDSIDILHDLSRNRRALVAGSHPSFQSDPSKSPYDEKAGLKSSSTASFEPFISYPPEKVAFSRHLGSPSAISISALILPEEGPPPYQHAGVPLTTRMIGRLLRSQAPEAVRLYLQESLDDPLVLVEYANFDSFYRESNMSPPLRNLDLLSEYLQNAKVQPQLNLLGYFEDPQTSRLGLIYDLADCIPNQSLSGQGDHDSEPVEACSLLHQLQTASKTAKTHETLTATPPLEERFQLALRIAEQIQCMHSTAFIHGNLTSDSIVFVSGGDRQLNQPKKLKAPAIGAFDLFSGSHAQASSPTSASNIYRHPEDQAPVDSPAARLRYDVYGLGLTLLEIGLWTPLSDLHKSKYQLKEFKTRLEKIWIPRLAVKCGSLYMSAVQACFNFSDNSGTSTLVSRHYENLVSRLRRCCLLCDISSESTPTPVTRPSFSPTTTQSSIPRKPLSASATPRHYSETSSLLRSSTHPSQASVYTLGSPVPAGSLASRLESARSTPRVEADQMTWQSDHGIRGLSFREIRRRVVVIQNHWRQRRLRKAQVLNSQAEKVAAESNLTDSTYPAQSHAPPRPTSQPKQRAFPVRLPPHLLADWHTNLGLRLSHIVERALKNSLESSTIDLVGLGHDEATAKPTILVTCTSTTKVKAAIKHRFQCDSNVFDVKVRKGTVGLSRRCGRTPRSQAAAAGERY